MEEKDVQEKESSRERQRAGGRGPGRGGRYVEPSERTAKDPKKAAKNIFRYFKKYLPLFSIAIITSILSSVFSLIGPSYLSKITNLIVEGLDGVINMEAVRNIGILLLVLYLGSGILGMVQGFITATLTARMSLHMRGDIIKKLNKLPIKFYDKNTTGDILSRITNDVFLLTNNLSNSLTTLVVSSIMLIGSLVLMLVTNLILTFTAILTVLIGAVFVFFVMKKGQKHFDNQQSYLGKINGHVEEAFSGHTVVKAYNAEDEMKERFLELNDTLKKHTFMAECLSGIAMPIIIFIDNLGYVIVAVVGAILAFQGSISFGVIVAFLVYIRYFSQPLTQISGLTQRLQVAAAAAERIFDFLNEEEMEDESDKIKNNRFIQGAIEFKNVKFGYDPSRVIIHNLNLQAKAGSKIAIVGPTGAGKTTIVNLLMRFHEIDEGSICIDGRDIRSMSREYIHSLFCMVLQDTWIFEGSIRENIVYNKEGVSDEEVIKAAKAVGIHHFITTLPKGYDTVLDEKVSLSMGQKQQLTIARAMVYNAPMLILDEATSSIDTRTEKYIQDAMDSLMENRTSFIIAHRLSTIKNADLILVLKDGDIIESGNHESLMKKNGFYTELYNSQFSEG